MRLANISSVQPVQSEQLAAIYTSATTSLLDLGLWVGVISSSEHKFVLDEIKNHDAKDTFSELTQSIVRGKLSCADIELSAKLGCKAVTVVRTILRADGAADCRPEERLVGDHERCVIAPLDVFKLIFKIEHPLWSYELQRQGSPGSRDECLQPLPIATVAMSGPALNVNCVVSIPLIIRSTTFVGDKVPEHPPKVDLRNASALLHNIQMEKLKWTLKPAKDRIEQTWTNTMWERMLLSSSTVYKNNVLSKSGRLKLEIREE